MSSKAAQKKKNDDDDDGRGTFTYHQLTILAQHAYALSLQGDRFERRKRKSWS